MILAGHRYNGRLGAYPRTINENSRNQTYATEKLLNVKKKDQKVKFFDHLKLIVYSETEI